MKTAEPIRTADYVIVGAGSAGCVLANRLTADGRTTVVLLEAGGWDRSPFIKVPIGYGATFNDAAVNWRYHSAPVPGLDGRTSYWPRGKIVGGSSAINAMVYVRGQAADYDDWAAEGNPEWGSEDVHPCFQRLEDTLFPHDDSRGSGGPMAISSVRSDAHPLTHQFVAAAQAAGLVYNSDYNAGEQEGVGYYQQTTRRGWRCSAAAGYLHPARSRRNLTVLTGAVVQRILLEAGRAVGVSCRFEGQLCPIRAGRAVILAAGAVNSPQLLELSGIGDGARLQALGIDVQQHNANVGEHLQDHIGVDYVYELNQPSLNQTLGRWPGRIAAAWTYLWRRGGPLSLSLNQGGGFCRSDEGRSRPNIQLYFAPLSFTRAPQNTRRMMQPDGFAGAMMGISNCHPKSRGSLHIATADPAAAPLIAPNYLADPADLEELVAGTKWLRRIAECAPLTSAIRSERTPGPACDDDAAVAADIRARAGTVFHPCGTCRMGPDPKEAVVDSQLRLHGIEGLRVVDASVFPSIPAGNINGPTLMVAERAAGMILNG